VGDAIILPSWGEDQKDPGLRLAQAKVSKTPSQLIKPWAWWCAQPPRYIGHVHGRIVVKTLFQKEIKAKKDGVIIA
jgi:hypothetical protein